MTTESIKLELEALQDKLEEAKFRMAAAHHEAEIATRKVCEIAERLYALREALDKGGAE